MPWFFAAVTIGVYLTVPTPLFLIWLAWTAYRVVVEVYQTRPETVAPQPAAYHPIALPKGYDVG
jgi:hypothetical protein